MREHVLRIADSDIPTRTQAFACHLLERLAADLCADVEGQGLPGSEQVKTMLREKIALYSREVCQEKPVLENLRRLQSELQSAIDRKDQFLAHILKESADAIITVNADHRIVLWNKGAETIFGFREEEIVDQPIARLVPASRQYELRQIEEQTRHLGAVNNRLSQWLTRQGKSIQIILTSTAIRDDGGDYTGSSFVIKDVTRQREMEEAVRQAEHFSAIGRLAAGLAHEIKNPLAGIQGAIEVIQDASDDKPQQKVLAEVLHEVGRIDKIVRDLLNYAKPKTPELKPLQLGPVVRHLIGLLRESSGRDVKFRILGKKAHREVTVRGDQGYLEQVLMNLLLNSIEAVNYRGTVTIRFDADPEALIVRVEDNGPGVPIGLQGKIFDPFFTTKQTGTGLGLATCRRIVHEHGGTLTLDTEVSKGAAFVLRLPRQESKADEKQNDSRRG